MKRVASLCLSLMLCLAIAAQAQGESTVQSAGEKLTPVSTFHQTLQMAAPTFQLDEFSLPLLAPVFSDGFWVRAIFVSGDVNIVLYLTDQADDAEIASIQVVSKEGASQLFLQTCLLTRLALLPSIKTHDLTELLGLLVVGEQAEGFGEALNSSISVYSFAVEQLAFSLVGVFTASLPYTVSYDMSKMATGTWNLPFANQDVTVKAFEENLRTYLENYYSISQQDLISLGVFDMEDGVYSHMFVLNGVVISAITAGESQDSPLTQIIMFNYEPDPPTFVLVAECVFSAAAMMSMEEITSMIYASGGRGAYDDFMSFLPAVALRDKMLVFSTMPDPSDSENTLPAAYIMGLPGGKVL